MVGRKPAGNLFTAGRRDHAVLGRVAPEGDTAANDLGLVASALGRGDPAGGNSVGEVDAKPASRVDPPDSHPGEHPAGVAVVDLDADLAALQLGHVPRLLLHRIGARGTSLPKR